MRSPQCLVLFLALVCSAFGKTVLPPPHDSPLLKEGNARVVLVGDSITGQSRNHPAGFAHQMDWALQQVYPGSHPKIVALGGSGQGVQAWLNTEKRSRTESFALDVKGLDVKTELDQPCDVLIIMLGMNDVLAPYVIDDPASWEKWTANYRELITALQTRLKPRVIAVATATLCTEANSYSPTNGMMDSLNRQLETFAGKMGLLVLPANRSMRQVLNRGREFKPDFHVTNDYVHPNEAGHIAIAMGLLRGLGEDKADRALDDQKIARILDQAAGQFPVLSYESPHYGTKNRSDRKALTFHAWAIPSKNAQPDSWWDVGGAGEGWEVNQLASPYNGTKLNIIGPADRHENPLKLTALTASRELSIPAPWLVAAGVIRKGWNEKQLLDAAAFHGPIEETIEHGGDFLLALDPTTSKPLRWQLYFATVDYTGGANPDSVDFAAVTHARNFEAGYGARWIYSQHDRPVNIELSTQTFASTLYMGVWLDGKSVYSGLLTGEPGKRKTVATQLHTGWNALVFALNHTAWQMQCTVHLAGADGDSLDDLRYSITPHAAVP